MCWTTRIRFARAIHLRTHTLLATLFSFLSHLEFSVLLTIPLVVLYVLCSIVLVVLVLLHSGKGGGLSDMFGGGMGAAAAGSTVVERNLTRMTVLASLVWMFLTIALAIRL